MPVRIAAIDDQDNPMVITLDEYKTGRANFSAHYFLEDCNTALGGQDLQISWKDFYAAIDGFIVANSVDPATVALRFVYCFDVHTSALYLRMQICTMKPIEDIPGTFNLITDICEWYELKDQVKKTKYTGLNDPIYLENMYYCEADTCTVDTEQCLDAEKPDTKYAKMVTYPWLAEVYKMYVDNKLPGNGYICFGATSYVNGGEGDAPVMYPHGMVLYLKNENGKVLMDDGDEVVLFHNKGCDMGTLCPQYCNVYIMPISE